MLTAKSFCTVPWFEVHINADGSYHTCGMQRNWITGTPLAKEYNIQTMSIPEWMSHSYMVQDRQNKLNGVEDPHCGSCYAAESGGGSSKRIRENLKSSIHDARFDLTFKHSRDNSVISTPAINNLNIRSFHFSLGNECNLYCRTCEPSYSSKIAFMEKHSPVRMNWTDNQQAWDHLMATMIASPDLQFVHVIGGEPFLNYRFEELINGLIAAGKTDIYFGFSTNGTIYKEDIFKKLQAFRHVDVGISLESTSKLNDYIRAGSITEKVIENIKRIQELQGPGYYVTLRTVISALSVHTYAETLQWALDNDLGILSNTLEYPPEFQVQNLPRKVKERLLADINWNFSDASGVISNGREPEQQKLHADNEMRNVINLLKQRENFLLCHKMYQRLTKWNWFVDPDIRKYFYIS